ncbi:MAG: bifunctional 2-polyprenyl-6-hydroxyphenol methylase/3-demethylubiquinol 3-O-methyltransferase UbiG [Rhodospirillales bacterium]|nr:bifunctional 2-polyprenyl-6-hydroxyphenol methylase/3-demethylubiquinol 3-O-methyltransferase UbiG [Rhodospirillales bacterium]
MGKDAAIVPQGALATAVPDELRRFAAIADAWWDPDGDFRPLHRLNPVRIAYVRDHLVRHFSRDPLSVRPLAGLEVLDIGCGGGIIAEPIRRLGARVTAIDAEQHSIRIAAAHAKLSDLDIDYRHAAPEDLVREGRQFDAVLALEVVEHVADLDAFVAATAGLMRPGGALVAATLNRTLKSLALGKVGAEYILRWLPRGTHDWRKFVRPAELSAALRRHGLAVRDLAGMTYNPLIDRWSLSDDLAVNYLVFATDES